MRKAKKLIDTGTIIARYRTGFGEKLVTAAVTLPEPEWEELTTHLIEVARDALDDPELNDLTLDERIDLYLELRTLEWEARCRWRPPSYFDPDLDDDVPF